MDLDEAHLDALLERLAADTAALAAMPLGRLEAPRAAAARRALRVVADRVTLATSALLAAVDADGRWATSGERTLPGWVARREGVGYGDARRELTLGRTIEDLPATRAAVVAGEITAAHAEALAEVAASSTARRAAVTGDQADRNEAFLLAKAKQLPVDEFRKGLRRWAIAVDAPEAEREHADVVARESLLLARRRDGVALTGFLTHERGAILATALRAVAGVPAKDDTRSTEQRQAAALVDSMRLLLDKGVASVGAQLRPHLSVLVDWDTLQRLTTDAAARDAAARDAAATADAAAEAAAAGDTVAGAEAAADTDAAPAAGADDAADAAATRARAVVAGEMLAPAILESGEPIPHSVLARLACDSEISRIVFGPDGHVLDVGDTKRTYTKQLRRAIIARDKHCQWPGCFAPPSLSEAHHVVWWARGGSTSIDNGVLLCWHHHDQVHTHDLTIRRRDDEWTFVRRDGTALPSPAQLRGNGAREGAAAAADAGGGPSPMRKEEGARARGGAPPGPPESDYEASLFHLESAM